MRSKRYFRGVWEQRKTEEGDFGYFARAENGARTKKRKIYSLYLSPCNSLLPNRTETLATHCNLKWQSISSLPDQVLGSKLVDGLFQADGLVTSFTIAFL